MATANQNSTSASLYIATSLSAKKITKVIIANIDGKITLSNPDADFLIPYFIDSPEWHNHESIAIMNDEETKCLYVVSIHCTKRGRPEGGARLKFYESFQSAVDDCLRLSYGMTLKNASGDIWEGGAKSVIVPYSTDVFNALMMERAARREDIGPARMQLWKNFGSFVSSLRGAYLCGEDVNLNSADMAGILQYCVHTSCLAPEVGGSGNPSPFTALGAYQAIRGAVEVTFTESPGLAGKKILVKGLGNVGYSLVRNLIDARAFVVAYDPINKEAKERARKEFPSSMFEIVEDYDQFVSTKADVFSPNANSLSINRNDIGKFNFRIICGAENGQVESEELIEELYKKGIVYVPEPSMNFMGVFSAYQEHRGILYSEFTAKAEEIYFNTKDLLRKAKEHHKRPHDLFFEIARRKAEEFNPLEERHRVKGHAHRGIEIIKELLNDWKTEPHDVKRGNILVG